MPPTFARGGYVLIEPAAHAAAVIIATGSEVALAVEAQKALAEAGIRRARRVHALQRACSTGSRGVSASRCCPWILPGVAVEAGVGRWPGASTWGARGGDRHDRFGESAPAGELFEHFGFTAQRCGCGAGRQGARGVLEGTQPRLTSIPRSAAGERRTRPTRSK